MGAVFPLAGFGGDIHVLVLQQRRISCLFLGKVGMARGRWEMGPPDPGSALTAARLRTIRAHRRGREPAQWRGRPWSPPETPAASASRLHSAKHSCHCTASPQLSTPTPQHIHTSRHILPTPLPQHPFPHGATHACSHGGDNVTLETLKWIQGSQRVVGIPQ